MNAPLVATIVFAAVLLMALAWWAWQRRAATPRGGSGDVDAEMREVFLAEARGEVAALDRHLPHWRQHPADLTRLQPLRRTFHTLKSAGRMVGADALGELCDRAEKLVLRVMERELVPQAEAVDAIARAAAGVQGLVDEFGGGARAPRATIAATTAALDRLLRSARNPQRAVATRD